MAQQQTTPAAGSAGQDPCLFHPPAVGSRTFWAAHAVNDDSMHQAFTQFVAGFHAESQLVRLSLHAANRALRQEAIESFREAQKRGSLLFAWYGSSALEGGAA